MTKFNMTVWGADFDYAPTGYVAPMTTELVLQGLEERGYIFYDNNACVRCTAGDWKTLVLPLSFSSHFTAVATIIRETAGLKGRVNIFSTDALTWREQDLFDADVRRTAAQVEFLVPYGFSWDAEGLFFSSDGPVNDEFAEYLTRDLIIATNAGTVIY